MNDILAEITGAISSFMYSYILAIMLVATGVYFTVRTRGVQIRFIKDMLTGLTEKKINSGRKSISSFQAMMISTASRVGTGNIAGVATAIAIGGPGSIFWMWVTAIIGSATAFVESTLAQIWKVKKSDGGFLGGPAYYIDQALGKRWLGIVFAVLLILCFALGFNGLQAFNVSSSLAYYAPDSDGSTSPIVAGTVGIILTILTAFVIFGGVKRISRIISVIVPAMAVFYILLSVSTVIFNFDEMGAVLSTILASAFDAQAAFGGFAGSCVMLGIKRGLFSNEAGMGSSPNAAATASVSHPVKQGLLQSLSVYVDTLLICSCSAMMVMVFYVQDPNLATTLNGIPLVQMAVNNSVGCWGIHGITLGIWAFAFSSIIGNYVYAEANLLFITKNKAVLFIFRLGCIAIVYIGSVNNFEVAWNLADILMGLMAIVNIIAITILGKWALKALEDYSVQRKQGKEPVFVANEIKGMPETECWHVPEIVLDVVIENPLEESTREADPSGVDA